MPGLKEIRLRLATVRSTRKITSAMKMVSAAKFHRAQGRHAHYSQYMERYRQVMALALQGGQGTGPLLQFGPAEKPDLLLVVASNSAMCGVFNASVVKLAVARYGELVGQQRSVAVWAYGRRAFEGLKRELIPVAAHDEELVQHLDYDKVCALYQQLQQDFQSGSYRTVSVVYNSFRNAAQQSPLVRQIFPVEVSPLEAQEAANAEHSEYIVEPSRQALFAAIVPQYALLQLYGAFLDNMIGEHGARMTAMTQATDNADTLIGDLTLEYNKARQSAITNEIVEIVSGADALRAQ